MNVAQEHVRNVASIIAQGMIEVARSAPRTEPVQFVTGNSYMPPLRSFPNAEAIWRDDEDGSLFEQLTEEIEAILSNANVLLACPDYDNALYVVDLARFEHVEGDDYDSLQNDWRPIER